MSDLNIHVSKLVVDDGGIGGECHENNSNMQEGVTKEGNLPHEGHAVEYSVQTCDCIDHNNNKKQQKENTQRRQEKERQKEKNPHTNKEEHKGI